MGCCCLGPPSSWVSETGGGWEGHLGQRVALGRLLQSLILFSCPVRAGSTLQGHWSRAGCCS